MVALSMSPKAALLTALLVPLCTAQVTRSASSNDAQDPSSAPTSTFSAPYVQITGPPADHNKYMKSPPVYPSPEAAGVGLWAEAIDKAKKFIADNELTLEEMVNLTTGEGWEVGKCVGTTRPIPRIDFPSLCLQDAPLGIRFVDGVSAFPAGINAAATFDRTLMYRRGYAIGKEFKGKGVHVALGPGMNMHRLPEGGRNYEMTGADPYLAGEVAKESIRGMQRHVQACAKHYIGNEQERNRTTSSSNIDDRTMHEIYLHPYLKSVEAGVASVMCSYNLVNGSWACQNSKLTNGLLKDELGFQGYLMSDWQATHSGVASVEAGLDMTMPGDVTFWSKDTYFGANLTEAVTNSTVAMDRVVDMAVRILGGYFLVGQDKDFPEVSFDSFRRQSDANLHIDVQGDHAKLIREIGAASTVLLKNEGGILPLKAPHFMAIVGNDAGPSSIGPNGFEDHGGIDGTLAMGWGSGTTDFPYLISPLEAIQARAKEDHTQLSWWLNNFDLEGAKKSVWAADVTLVFVNRHAGEGYITVDGNEGDTKNISAWLGGDELIQAIASVKSNVVVIAHSVGQLDVEAWIDHPNISALVWAGLPGQESGNSLVDILYGDCNPSARLPYTIGKKLSDYPAEMIYVNTDVDPEPQVNYDEGLNIDYRHFLSAGIEPRYGFGYGLSYTNFTLGNLKVRVAKSSEVNGDIDTGISSETTYGPSLHPDRHAFRWAIDIDVTNTGSVYGCDVPQLYLEFPEAAKEPPRVMKGFDRVSLAPGASTRVTFLLSRYSLSFWDVITQSWVIPEGDFGIVVSDRGPFDSEAIEGASMIKGTLSPSEVDDSGKGWWGVVQAVKAEL